MRAAYRTSELAVDPEGLAGVVRARLHADPAIRFRAGTEVLGVARDDETLTVRSHSASGPATDEYDHVVNCLWEGRLAVDATAGVEPERPWLYRVKHYLRLQTDAMVAVPSTTIVLGAFGDTVTFDDGGMFLSWYPVGRRGTSSDLSPPAWPLVLDGASEDEVRRATRSGLAEVIRAVDGPPSRLLEESRVEGGIIVAHGHSDIDDPTSVLHERHAIGPRSSGRYHTVDTDKLTMAPLFGWRTAGRVLAPDALDREPVRA